MTPCCLLTESQERSSATVLTSDNRTTCTHPGRRLPPYKRKEGRSPVELDNQLLIQLPRLLMVLFQEAAYDCFQEVAYGFSGGCL